LDALLDDAGMGYANLPKGLLHFHSYPGGARTPFEEHLAEGAALLRDTEGKVRLHFTVSPQHRARFEALLEQARARLASALGVRFPGGFCEQKSSTDTIALDGENLPVLEKDGSLLFRPAGHGALLENLQDTGFDVVLLKNIDNIVPDRLRSATLVWS